jgi:hypothetical protein
VTNKISLPWHLNPRRSEEVLDKIVGIFVESKPEIQDKILNDEISFDDAKEQNALIQEVTRKLGAAKARRRLGEEEKNLLSLRARNDATTSSLLLLLLRMILKNNDLTYKSHNQSS